ncbi:hypothetical protein IQ260_11190 [Leptolyngbya cf. ectocarpi LEGE 11479]|uniref:Uncharacterized protein n=1 Tax=Leptolyngbya cf. ectocarpi LEGE 11479 TaxID=1828722 RepID=A0A928X3S8_LEPEC|nr:hypothetical protein [Leptolyngbya ectocarpi]MBE9067221.1 hypothetical protein [Leptolyngbya cf. ectocarpi LEGE 11479]
MLCQYTVFSSKEAQIKLRIASWGDTISMDTDRVVIVTGTTLKMDEARSMAI